MQSSLVYFNLKFKHKYLTVYAVKIFEISSTHFYTTLVQDPQLDLKKENELHCTLQKPTWKLLLNDFRSVY